MKKLTVVLLAVTMLTTGAASTKLYYAWCDHWRVYNECTGDVKGVNAYESLLDSIEQPLTSKPKKYIKHIH
jgi:hypothetical protein